MFTREEIERIEIARKCRDCNYFSKVRNAGKIFKENGIEYQFMHNGIKVFKDCYVGEWVTELISQMRGIHEPQEEKVFYEVLKSVPENGVMLELGSYWAYYSMWFNKEIKNAKNYLIEPIEDGLEKGRKNFVLNNMNGDFNQGFIGSEFAENVEFINWDGTKININCFSIDHFVNDKEIPFINLLHSDIQGAEYNMLQGCKESIKNNKIGYIFISTHSNDVHQKCINFLKEYNFKIIAEHNLDESFSTDGLIAAYSPAVKGIAPVKISKRKRTFFQKNFKSIINLFNNIKYSIKYAK